MSAARPLVDRITVDLECPKCGKYTTKVVADIDPSRYFITCAACTRPFDIRTGNDAELVKELKEFCARVSAAAKNKR